MLTDAESYFGLQIYCSFTHRNHRRSAESLRNITSHAYTYPNPISLPCKLYLHKIFSDGSKLHSVIESCAMYCKKWEKTQSYVIHDYMIMGKNYGKRRWSMSNKEQVPQIFACFPQSRRNLGNVAILVVEFLVTLYIVEIFLF